MGNSTLISYGGSSPSVNESSNFYFNDLKSFIIHLSTPLISGSFGGNTYFISVPIFKYINNKNPSNFVCKSFALLSSKSIGLSPLMIDNFSANLPQASINS